MSKDSERITSKIHKFLDDNIRFIQYPCYAVGVIGLGMIARSTYMFSKFTSASSIPQEFLTKGVKLRGRVLDIIPATIPSASNKFHPAKLCVEHIPIVTNKFKRENHSNNLESGLKVEIAGIQVNSNGIVKIQKLVPLNSSVWFKLLGADVENDIVFASVFLKSTWKNLWRSQDLAFILLKQRVATVSPYNHKTSITYSNSYYSEYYRKLLFCESKARQAKKFGWLHSLWSKITKRKSA